LLDGIEVPEQQYAIAICLSIVCWFVSWWSDKNIRKSFVFFNALRYPENN